MYHDKAMLEISNMTLENQLKSEKERTALMYQVIEGLEAQRVRRDMLYMNEIEMLKTKLSKFEEKTEVNQCDSFSPRVSDDYLGKRSLPP